jgi:hypothetical protein
MRMSMILPLFSVNIYRDLLFLRSWITIAAMAGALYVVVGNPLSDIGKGWLAGSIASILPSACIIKVDAVLTSADFDTYDPTSPLNESADAKTYRELGIPFTSDQLFFQGNILLDFLQRNLVTDGKDLAIVPRYSYSDVARHFADKICDVYSRSGKKDVVIEIGGSVNDPELSYIPQVLRLVAAQEGLTMKILLLSYLDYSEDPLMPSPTKPQHVIYAIRQTRSVYQEPFMVFFRRRNLPASIEEDIESIKETISRRAIYAKENIIYLRNFASPLQERDFIRSIPAFND